MRLGISFDATGDLLKVKELNLQRQCAPLKVILLDAPDQFQNCVVKMDSDNRVLADELPDGWYGCW